MFASVLMQVPGKGKGFYTTPAVAHNPVNQSHAAGVLLALGPIDSIQTSPSGI